MIFGTDSDAAAGFFKFDAAEQFANEAADQRHTGLSADENDLVESFGLEFGIGERAKAMGASASNNVAGQVFKFRSGEFVAETEIGCEERKRNFHFGFARKADFGGFGHFADTSEERRMLMMRDAWCVI